MAQPALGKALPDASALGLPHPGILVKSDPDSAFKSQPGTAWRTQHGWGQPWSAVGHPEGMGRVERVKIRDAVRPLALAPHPVPIPIKAVRVGR